MSKIKRCVHCLKVTETTRDHVFPDSWYPDNTPDSVNRPTAPACYECNHPLGEIEERLLENIVLCMDPKAPEASGLREKVMRKFGIGVTPEEIGQEEWEKRNKRRIEKLKELKPFKEGMGYFPGFGPQPGFPTENQFYIDGPLKDLEIVSEKIIRGLEHWHDRRYIEAPYVVSVHFAKEGADLSSFERFFTKENRVTYGTGFKVERPKAVSDLYSSLYRINVLGKYTGYGVIMTKDQLDMASHEK